MGSPWCVHSAVPTGTECFPCNPSFFVPTQLINQQNHKIISPLPFFHIYGLTVSLLYCAWKGQQIITMSGRFDLETFCQLVQEYQPKRAHLVPLFWACPNTPSWTTIIWRACNKLSVLQLLCQVTSNWLTRTDCHVRLSKRWACWSCLLSWGR